MEKYWVVYDGIKPNTREEAAAKARVIDEQCAVIAPDTYVMLSMYAEMFPLVIDTNTCDGKYWAIGIESLAEMGYIEIGGACKNDEYKMIWIVK